MQTSRNILIIVQNLPVPFDRRVWQEATSLRRHGFGVAVICPKKGSCTASYERLEDVDIYRYPLIYEANKGVAGYFVEFVYCWLASLWLALKAYTHRPFHAIHACNPPDTFFALALLFRPLGVKFVFDHHDLCPEMYVAKGRSRTGMLYRGLVMLERMTLRSADMVIAVNESHKEIALKRGGIAEAKVAVVRSGPRGEWADIHSVPRTETRTSAHGHVPGRNVRAGWRLALAARNRDVPQHRSRRHALRFLWRRARPTAHESHGRRNGIGTGRPFHGPNS
jgi:glycosyltransferase involved in cell wall biosynthesis